MKIINQYMVKDTHRNMKYTGTMRCVGCEEESHLPETYPYYIATLSNHLRRFINLHDTKGCNDKKLQTPEWVSGTINLSVSQ